MERRKGGKRDRKKEGRTEGRTTLSSEGKVISRGKEGVQWGECRRGTGRGHSPTRQPGAAAPRGTPDSSAGSALLNPATAPGHRRTERYICCQKSIRRSKAINTFDHEASSDFVCVKRGPASWASSGGNPSPFPTLLQPLLAPVVLQCCGPSQCVLETLQLSSQLPGVFPSLRH